MFYEIEVMTGIADVGKNQLITNTAILRILENVACYQSDEIGYGILDISKNKISWILLDWKVKVLNRPMYGEKLLVKTWGRNPKRVTVGRDFEIYNSNNELCVIGTSKWAIVNTENKSIERITQEMIDKYKMDEKSVFDEIEIPKPIIPNSFMKSFTFKPLRRNIDINGHVHNTHYLEMAYESLPENVYQKRPYNNFRISYKKEIKMGDVINCKYTFDKNKHIIVFINEKESIINGIVELWN